MPADGTGLAVSLQSADAAAYEWDPATEAGTLPAVPEPPGSRQLRMAAAVQARRAAAVSRMTSAVEDIP